SDFVGGDIKALIQAMPQVVKRLFAGGGTGMVLAPTQPPPTAPHKPVAPPAPEVGSLTLSTTPSGVTCSIAGKDIGTTPCHAADLPVGRYEVELRKDYYHPRTVVVYVYKGVDTAVSYD